MVAFIPGFKVVKYYYNMSGISQMKELVFYYMYKYILKSNWGIKSLAEKLQGAKILHPSICAIKEALNISLKGWLKTIKSKAWFQ